MTLTWSAAPGAGYYEVFRCNENNSSRQSVGTTAETTFTVTGLAADMGYYFVAAGRTKVHTENNKVECSLRTDGSRTGRCHLCGGYRRRSSDHPYREG